MPSEVLNYFLKNSNWKVRLGFQLALQCAPFLKGLKVSCVISVDAYLYRGLGEMFRGLEVDYRMLSCSQGKCLVLFYRPDELERHLREQRLHSLIREYGYENMSLQENDRTSVGPGQRRRPKRERVFLTKSELFWDIRRRT